MKNCTRLDVVSSNTIKMEHAMASANAPQKKRVVSSPGTSIAKKLGPNWKQLGSCAELTSEVDGVKTTAKVELDSKTHQYKFSVRLVSQQQKTPLDPQELNKSISEALVGAVKSVANLGNQLG